MFFSKNIKKGKNSTENCHFYSREKSPYKAWACFRNEISEGKKVSSDLELMQLELKSRWEITIIEIDIIQRDHTINRRSSFQIPKPN